MPNIHYIKSICNQYLYIICNAKWGPKYRILNYKPTHEWHLSCEDFGKGLLPWHP